MWMMSCSSLSQVLILFLAVKVLIAPVHCQKQRRSQRLRREWVIPSIKLWENKRYTLDDNIGRILSDMSVDLYYTLKGPGADQPPYNLFLVDKNGNVHVTGILDREEIPEYNLVANAWFRNNTIAEKNMNLFFKVLDENDNPPVFTEPEPVSIYEGSPGGTFVTRIIATDADLPGSLHTKISYKIINQDPDNGKLFFTINKHSGNIYVKDSSLDRETQNSYVLTVKATDMDGDENGNSATTTVQINLLDINDNMPTLDKDEYVVSVDENMADAEVLRIPAMDKDEERTDNWYAIFQIVSGNEDGYFAFKTDPNTNEGILYVVKPIDFETAPNLQLGVMVENKAPPGLGGGVGSGGGDGAGGGAPGTGTGSGVEGAGGSGSRPGKPSTGFTNTGLLKQKIYSLKVNVNNKLDGPKYNPKTKHLSMSENNKGNSIPRVIATYPAIDGDTGRNAENVRYAKGYDPANWLAIDEQTAEITLTKEPDRESTYLINGTYYAKILCLTNDIPSKTATGTIAIQVEDFNDHCPRLTSLVQDMCTIQGALYVSAMDEDPPPNGIPFTFSIVPEKTQGKWSIEHLNDTTAILRTQETLWPGPKEVTVQVRDQQGLSCPEPQVLKVDVCTCDISGHCSPDVRKLKGSVLGGAGISLILLALLMLLLIPLLLLSCQCGTAGLGGGFADMPFDTKEHLIPYNTEGQGEDRDVVLYIKSGNLSALDGVLCKGNDHWINAPFMNKQWVTNHSGNSQTVTDMTNMAWKDDGLALSEQFLNHYYSGKCQELDSTAMNSLLVYNEEGRGSPVGSVSSLSFLDSGNDLEFLNDLEPKFTTLAEICGGTKFMTAISAPAPAPAPAASAPTPTPAPAPVLAPPRPRPTIEAVSTNINTINAVNTTSTVNTASTISAHARPAQPSSVHVERNVVVNDSHTSIVTDATPAQTVLVQQQPLYYVVEPQVPSTVLLTERPAVGLGQGMYVLNGAEGVLVQGSVGAQNTGLLRSAKLLVERGAQGEQILQGTLQRGGPQSLLLVEAQGGFVIDGAGGLHVEGAGGSSGIVHGSQQRGMTTSSWSQSETVGLNGNSVQVSGLPTSRKVVIQEKKVVSSQGNL